MGTSALADDTELDVAAGRGDQAHQRHGHRSACRLVVVLGQRATCSLRSHGLLRHRAWSISRRYLLAPPRLLGPEGRRRERGAFHAPRARGRGARGPRKRDEPPGRRPPPRPSAPPRRRAFADAGAIQLASAHGERRAATGIDPGCERGIQPAPQQHGPESGQSCGTATARYKARGGGWCGAGGRHWKPPGSTTNAADQASRHTCSQATAAPRGLGLSSDS